MAGRNPERVISVALNDVSLTSGMRSNLLSLQATGILLDRTQTRLSTGKKVNTAIDNPVSFFAAQSLSSRASVIDSLKDAMGQAVSTINAADEGITSITSMIEQAKGLAQSAQSADNTQDTVSVTLTGITSGATVVLANADMTLTAQTSASTSVQFTVGSTQGETATNLAALINSTTYAATNSYSATVNGAVLTVTKYTRSIGRETDAAASDVTVSAGANKGVTTAGESELESLIAQYNTLRTQLTELAEDSGYKGKNLLSATSALHSMTVKFEGTTLTVQGFDATATGLGIKSASSTTRTTSTTTTGTVSTVLTASVVSVSGSGVPGDRVSLPTGTLSAGVATDANANPQNYRIVDSATLGSGGTASGQWNGSTPSIGGDLILKILSGSFSASEAVTLQYCASGFNQTTGAPNSTTTTTSTTSGGWLDPAAIETSLTELDSALITLRKQSSSMSSNLSIITTRQNFSSDMMNTLTAGADKLTLADTNEEGANMLMLQTRQSLGTTALSLSAQASQAVLKLFG